MPKRSVLLTIAVFAGATLWLAPAPVSAQVTIEEGKAYRVILTNNDEVVGQVKVVGDTYKIKFGTGITQTFKKSQVREIKPLEEVEPSGPGSLGRRVTDAEIESILGSEDVTDLYVWDYVQQIDLMQPLETDDESLEVMKRYAGKSANVLETDHFIVVYTSDKKGARRLAARLESTYKWNITFMRMFNIPPEKPAHRLEIFYFGTYDEYRAYQALCGFMSEDALGFYTPANNRCAFFDMMTYPPVARLLEVMRDTNAPFQERRKAENKAKAYTNYANLEVVQHEATHAIHFNVGIFPKAANIGKWMTEGLCVQFEVPPTQAGGSFGSMNHHRLQLFREMYGKDGEKIPWDFVKQMVMSAGFGFNDYVMGWALNYYLRSEYKEEYGAFVRNLAGREPWSYRDNVPPTERLAEFEENFGTLDEEWVKEFFAFISQLRLKNELVPPRP